MLKKYLYIFYFHMHKLKAVLGPSILSADFANLQV